MNDDTNNSNPAEKNESLGVWNNPELEARIVAMEMGELSAFEMAELTEELEKSPELRLFQERIVNVRDTIKEVQQDDHIEDDWKLPTAKRETILSKISQTNTPVEEKPVTVINTKSIQWRNAMAVAACFLVSLVVLAIVFPFRKSTMYKNEAESIAYKTQSDRGIDVVGGTSHPMSSPEMLKELPHESDIAWAPEDPKGEINEFKSLKRKPSSPSTNKPKVIAAKSPSPTAVPLPDSLVTEPTLDFGDGSDFGAGWGNGRGRGDLAKNDARIVTKSGKGRMNIDGVKDSVVRRELPFTSGADFESYENGTRGANYVKSDLKNDSDRSKINFRLNYDKNVASSYNYSKTTGTLYGSKNSLIDNEIASRQSRILLSDKAILKGRTAYRNGKIEEAVENYEKALKQLPQGPIADQRRKSYTQHITQGQTELAKKYRREGKYNAAREALNKALALDPTSELAKKKLEYLDDPIRTSPTLTNEHVKNIEKTRKLLYRGESYFNQGQFDHATKEYKAILANDPYNKAARRGMEKVNNAKSEYYRAAYDQTRAAMLMEVDKAWEMAVPPSSKVAEQKKNGLGLSKDEVSKELAQVNEELKKLKQQVEKEEGTLMFDAEDNTQFGKIKDEYELEFKNKVKLVEQYKEATGTEKEKLAEKVKFAEDKVADNRARLYQISKRLGIAYHGVDNKTATAVGRGKSSLKNQFDDKTLRLQELELQKKLLDAIEEQPERVTKALSARRNLQNAKISNLSFNKDTTVEESLAHLQKEMKKKGMEVKFNIRDRGVKIGSEEGVMGEYGEEDALMEDKEKIGELKIGELQLNNVPAEEALRQIAQMTGLRYKVNGDGSVEILRATDLDATEMYTRSFRVPQDFKKMLSDDSQAGNEHGDPFDDGEVIPLSKMKMPDLLTHAGVPFPEGSTATYSAERGVLTVRNTANNIDLIEQLAKDVKIERIKTELKELKAKTAAKKLKAKESKVKEPQARQLKLPNETSATDKSDSTFSLNVSDASFQLARAAMLEQNKMPTPDQIRVEEFVNAFDYGDPSANGKKVTCVMEQAAHPFYQQRNLMRIGMKTGTIGRTQPLRLTILLDNSGSMERADRAETVQAAIRALASKLTAADEVTLISFSRTSRLVAEKIKGNQVTRIAALVKSIPSEGGTNLSGAMEQAYAIAKRNKAKGALSRIILITDGAANLGNAKPEELAKKVITMRQDGIAFDACGVGVAGINDTMLEALTRKGDGRYYFINKAADADAEFAQKLAGALRPAAKNVKVQVIFNPQRVGNYRLLGFEKHLLKKEEFRNDKVDAAEMAAEESGNALYQLEAKPNGVGAGDIGRVFVRFRDTETNKMVERSWAIPYQPSMHGIDQAKPSLQLSTVAAMLAERLKYGEQSGVDLQQFRSLYNKLRLHYSNDKKVIDLIRMCEKASSNRF